jgi:hypothetical protein
MKTRIILLIMTALAFAGCRSSGTAVTGNEAPAPAAAPVADEAAGHVWDFRDATTWLLGEINLSGLLMPPYDSWYLDGFAGYVPDEKIMDELRKTDISDYTITIVLGTWCPDSRSEVPRCMKIIDIWGFPSEKIKLIGVDINKVAPLAD